MSHPVPILLMARALSAGGSERQMVELALALAPAEFTVHVGCFEAYGVRAAELEGRGIPIVRLPVRSFRSPRALRAAWMLGRYLRRHRIRLVHTFDLPLTCFGVPVAWLFRVPVVLSSQRAHRGLQPELRRLVRFTDRLVDGVVVNCDAMRRHMIEDEGVDPKLLHVCYNWIDTQVFRPQPKLRSGAFAQASVVIGVVCVLRPEKDLITLIEAFAQVAHIAPGLVLLIVGSGSMLDTLQVRARELDIFSQCVFQPEVSDVTPWLREVDIFVLPSRTEALSNSLMEAMACGCAVIASRVGGNPELVTDADTGLLFEPGDLKTLAEKLGTLIRDDSLRAKLGARAAGAIRQRFDRQAMLRRIEDVYRSYPPLAEERFNNEVTQPRQLTSEEENRPFRHYSFKQKVTFWISENLFQHFTYTVRHGLIKGMKRKGGLGWVPQRLTGSRTREEKFWSSLDLRGKVVYDVGAFHGVLTLFFASRCAKVVSYEPNSINHARLLKNLQLNGLENVTVRKLGVGDRTQRGTLVFMPLAAGGGSLEEKTVEQMKRSNASVKSEAIEITTIDQDIEHALLPPPDFLKIDIEGWEIEALRGARKTLERCRPALFLEMHGETIAEKKRKVAELVAFLNQAGYGDILHVETGTAITSENTEAAKEGHLFCPR